MHRVATTLLSVLVVLGLSGCGQDDAPAQPRPDRAFNQADVAFAVAMQSHHQQAFTAAEMAREQAAMQELSRLAEEVVAARGPEIDLMAGWLRRWAKQGGELPGHGDEPHVEGMLTPQDMSRLESAAGAEFDRLWLRMMIKHRRGAVEMAREHGEAGRHPGAQSLATDVVRTQTREIREMRRLLADS
jgi:uncharacterized protein (DUF305 family)